MTLFAAVLISSVLLCHQVTAWHQPPPFIHSDQQFNIHNQLISQHALQQQLSLHTTALKMAPITTQTVTSTATPSMLLSVAPDDIETIMNMNALPSSPLVIAIIAILLGAAAQTFINQMLKGDQGLGAFLKDGSGYNRSGFVSKRKNGGKEESGTDDPLPWLKLPQLDFVDVAGQEKQVMASKSLRGIDGGNGDEGDVVGELESLRSAMNEELENGNVAEATVLREKLERRMKANGMDYQSDS